MPKQNLTNSQFIRRKSVGYFNEGGEADKEELEKQARLDTYRTEQANDALASLINSYRMTGRGAEDIARVTGLPIETVSSMFGATDTELPSAELAQESRLGEFRETTPKVMTDEGTRLRPGYELRSVPKDLMAPTNREPLEDYIRRFNIQRSGVNPRVQMFEDGGEVSNDDFIRQMTVGTLPADAQEGKAEGAFRALVEGGQGFFGLEPGRKGTEAYRTGQALSNIPPVAIPLMAVKAVPKVAGAVEDVATRAVQRITENPNLSAVDVYNAMFGKQAPGVPITTYHGSGNLFQQLDPSKAKSGVGEQRYGMGAGYTAESRPVAESFIGAEAQALRASGGMDPKLEFVYDLVSQKRSDKDVLDMVAARHGDSVSFDEAADILQKAKSMTKGYLYKGDIPDEILPSFLDWNKSLKQQTPEVKKLLGKDPLVKESADPKRWNEVSGGIIQKGEGGLDDLTGDSIYKYISLKLGSDSAATEYLDKLGVRGIRYADPGSKGLGRAPSGTSNFVVFRPEDYRIESVNDVPVVKTPEIKKSGKITELENRLKEEGGVRQAQRLQRAADEIPGLENQYQSNALMRAFLGRKGYPYQGVMTMKPEDFEQFALPLGSPLSQSSKERIEKLREVLAQGGVSLPTRFPSVEGAFDDVPFLMMDRKDNIPFIAGHEGRHRMRALSKEGYPATLVEVYPRSALEMGGDYESLTATEWLKRFNEALGKDRLVVPEDLDPALSTIKRKLPETYAKGGEVTNEDFIEQMTVGTRPTDQEADPNVVKDIVRGVQYTPFDVLGAPVDIATMVMRPFGYNVEKPFGGSDYFIEQAAKRGLVQPSTGSGAELLGRIAGGVTTPAAAKGVGKVAAKTEDFISGQLDTAAKKVEERSLAKLREQTGNPNLSAKEVYDAMFAAQAPGAAIIKPKGGNVIMENVDMVEGKPVRSSPIANMRPTITVPGEKNLPPSQFYASDLAARLKEQIERNKQAGYPTAYMESQLSDIAPKAALDNWIQTKLSKYIRTDMGTEGDPVRKLAEEMSTKVRANYEAGLKRIAKMKEDIAKAKAAGKNTEASEAELAAEIDKVENAYRQTSMLPVSIGPYTHPSKKTAENREMAGFSPFPISKSSLGKEWEEIADRQFYLHRAGDLVEADSPAFRANPWLANINPEEIVYTAPYVDEMHMFTHTLDELENALNPASGLPQKLQLKPEDMQQLGIEKAFRLVNDINDWRLQQRIALNLEEAKRAAVTVKQYPDAPGGLQWQELKAPAYTELPPGYAIEQLDYNTAVLKGPDGKSLTYFDDIASGNRDVQKEALSFLAKNDLERALKYEGSTMRHCVGGYCDDVWSGNTRIYSLRDSKGEPHVTIETAPAIRGVFQNIETFLQENPGNITGRLGFDADDFLYARQNASPFNPEAERELDRFFNAVQNTPEFNQWRQANPPGESILQIKGKANQKPTEKYIPFVQDFLSSRQWYSIGDRENADLVPLQSTLLKNAQDRGFTPNVVTTAGDQPYITKEEFNRLAKLFGGMNEYAAGGEVTNFIRAHA